MIIYVNAMAVRGGDGSQERPYKWINDAAKKALPGDTILVAPGIYREHVIPKNKGTKEAPIVYRSEVPLGAEITGAEIVQNWKPYQGNVWYCEIDNGIFGSYNPYTTFVDGDWYFAKPVCHTGAVFLDDRSLYETLTLEECIKGEIYASSWEPEFSIYKWYTEQRKNKTVLYANFQGRNPNEEKVDISVRRNCFMPDENGIDYITVSGFKIDKAATTWAPPASYQDGMIGPHWSKGWIIEDCEIFGSKCVGISLGKYCDPENDQYFTHKHVKSPTQMERDAVCRGQYHGWLKENIGGHIVRRCHIHHCEQAGIAGRMGAVFSIIEDNHIHNINNMQQLGGAEIAGIKIHAAIDVTFKRNHIHHCSMGIWCDWEAQGTRITQNLLHDNQIPDGSTRASAGVDSQDLFVEVGHGPTLIDNNVLLSKGSLRIATEGVAMVHNLICGSFLLVGSGTDSIVEGKNQPRYTPYHIPHRTEVMGFMTILHGDDRFFNNIFVQRYPVGTYENEGYDNKEVGTHVFDEYPDFATWIRAFKLDEPADMMALESIHFSHLPVWSGGNAYFNGARAWNREDAPLVDRENTVYISLKEEADGLHLSTNVYEYLKEYSCSIITSDTLGQAFEPQQRFENPDGTSITFDRDYFDSHRRINPLPGPFASEEESKKTLFV